MKKLLLMCHLLIGALLIAQVNYSQNWNTTGLNGWTTSGSVFSNNTTASQICGTTGGTIRGERWYGNSGQFTSPSLPGNTTGQVTMSFDYKVTNYSAGTTATPVGSVGNIAIEYANAATGPWIVASTINSTNHIAANTCAPKTITFVPSAGNLFVRFNVTSDSNSDVYYYFDNVNITQTAAPTCMAPSAITLVNYTANTANISWTAPTPAPALGYDVYYNTTGVAPTAGTVLNGTNSVTSATTTATISGLLPTTTYYVWVRAKCTASDQSFWIPMQAFTTPCAAITVLPWVENFDAMATLGAGIVPSCWKNVTGTNAWTSSNAASSGTSPGPRSGANYMRLVWGTSTASQLWTPGFNLTAGVNYEFSFYYHTAPGSSNTGWTGSVLVNNAQATAGSTNLGTFITSTQSTNNYTLYKVYYSPATSGTYYFAANVSSTSNPYYLGLDDFKLRVAPTCLDVQGLAVTNTTTTSTTIQWTVPTPAPAGGYDVYYTTTPGIPAPTVTPQFSGVSGPTQQINGLATSQTYYIWVRARCSATDIGDWTGPLQVYTNYCLPTGGSSSTTYYVNNITATGGLTGLNYTANSYTAYVNNTAQVFSVVPGGSQNITVGGSSTASKFYYAWIDWNRDMVFDTSPGSNEVIISTTSYSTTPATGIINSVGHLSGDYRVRFAISELGQITPCGPAPYGNYVDYTFRIVPCSTDAPTITSVDQINNVQARVNWTLSGPNLDVIIKWREAGTTGWPAANTVTRPATPTNYTITGLQASKAYEVIIIAVCGATEGTPSPLKPFSTTCDPAPPFVSVSQITTTTALVSWNPTLNANFVLQYRKVGAGMWEPQAAPGHIPVNGTSYLLTGLAPFTKYEVKVANVCVSAPTVINPYSTPAVFTTVRTCDMPVPGLTITYMTTTTAQVQWEGLPSASSYVVRYRKVGFPSWTEVPSNTNNITLTGLIEDTKYEMQVLNVCGGVRGSWSDPYYFTTPTIIYCQMTAGSAANEYISGVLVRNSAGAELMKNEDGNVATTYSNYTTNSDLIVNLVQGSTGNQLTVTKKWAGTQENAGLAAWIDFNRDGIFQPTERIMASQPSKTTPITSTFDVPADAFVSMTDYKYVIMRVAISRDEIPVNCVSMANGEVEDYLVRISKTPIPSGINPDEIVIYPNPVTTVLYVKNMEDRANYKIYNAAGQLLKSGLILSGKVDVSGLIKGVYVIDLQDSKNNVQKKFIKN